MLEAYEDIEPNHRFQHRSQKRILIDAPIRPEDVPDLEKRVIAYVNPEEVSMDYDAAWNDFLKSHDIPRPNIFKRAYRSTRNILTNRGLKFSFKLYAAAAVVVAATYLLDLTPKIPKTKHPPYLAANWQPPPLEFESADTYIIEELEMGTLEPEPLPLPEPRSPEIAFSFNDLMKNIIEQMPLSDSEKDYLVHNMPDIDSLDENGLMSGLEKKIKEVEKLKQRPNEDLDGAHDFAKKYYPKVEGDYSFENRVDTFNSYEGIILHYEYLEEDGEKILVRFQRDGEGNYIEEIAKDSEMTPFDWKLLRIYEWLKSVGLEDTYETAFRSAIYLKGDEEEEKQN